MPSVKHETYLVEYDGPGDIEYKTGDFICVWRDGILSESYFVSNNGSYALAGEAHAWGSKSDIWALRSPERHEHQTPFPVNPRFYEHYREKCGDEIEFVNERLIVIRGGLCFEEK